MSNLTSMMQTGGYRVAVESETRSLHEAVVSAVGGSHDGAPVDSPPADITLRLEASRRRFDVTGFELVTRGVWTNQHRETVLEDVGGSGFAQLWTVVDGRLVVRARWSPSPLHAAAAVSLPARFRALRGQVLLHYPVLWWAAVHGRAPLHVSVLEVDGVVVLLAGPGGVGKSTLVARELSSGAAATCDNLAVSDGRMAYGVREPLRLSPGPDACRSGARAAHGRREQPWPYRVPFLTPDLVVVLRRGDENGHRLTPVTPEIAERTLVAGTYTAGELRRFWPLAATLALASGRGPTHPPVEPVAKALTTRLPCVELRVAATPGARLASLLASQLTELHRQGVGR
jgi:hypothetical protein